MLHLEIERGYAPAPEFDAGLRNDLKAVADSVADAVAKLFVSSAPPAGARRIWCYYEPGVVPMVVFHPTEYPIRLSVLDRNYCKFAFQLSHELAHIMMDPRQDNWIVESVAVAVSLQILETLAKSWQTEAPHSHWSNFAPNFANYARNEVSAQMAGLDPSTLSAVNSKDWDAVTAFLKGERDFLDSNPVNRPMNMLCAVRMLAEPMFWPEFIGLAARTAPPPTASTHFNGNIPTDISQLSPRALEMLRRIGL